jgi:RNA polymerase sigma-54 factor
MKASNSLQLGQQLRLTPQLLQSIRLLQLDSLQLEQELRTALELNPMLELAEEALAEQDQDAGETALLDVASPEVAPLEVAAFDELPEGSMWDVPAAPWREGDDDGAARIAAGASSDPQLRVLQRVELELEGKDLEIATFWLEHCDDAGYLDGTLEALTLRACAHLDVPAARAERIRQLILHGDPVGMAAASLHECLTVQLAALPGRVPGRPLAQRILDSCMDEVSRHDYPAIARRLDAEVEDIREAVRVILSLQPRPGEADAPEPAPYVLPDVITWFADGQWRVALNPATAPRIGINSAYERALSNASDDAGSVKLREMLAEARWLTRGLSMRYDTLIRTARVIIERQAAFLERGDEAMAPLTLKEVADTIGMHESTISRITSGKYLQTPRGTFELKRFFAVRLEGANVSGAAVKAMVRRLIESEPLGKPLADEAIASLLARQGVHIARRTVAKYREQLDIAPAPVRRRDHAAQLARAG